MEVDSTEEGQVTLHRGHTQTHPSTVGPWRPASGPQDTRSGRSRQCCGSAHWDRAQGRPHTHSHLSNGSKEERQGLEAPRSCTPRAQDTQVVIGEVGGDSASLRARESVGRSRYQVEGLCLDLKDFDPHDMHLPVCDWRGDCRGPGSWLPSQMSPFLRAKPWAQAGSVDGRTRVGPGSRSPSRPSSRFTPVLSTCRRRCHTWDVPSPPGRLPGITRLAAFAGAPPGSPQGGTALGPQGGSM